MPILDYLLGDVLCFDTETALLGDKVCEIGFSLFRNAKVINEFSMFINPGMPIDPEASNVHNIYDSDVKDAPYFKDVPYIVYNTINSADIILAITLGNKE